MKSFRKAIAAVLITVIMVQIFSFSVFAEEQIGMDTHLQNASQPTNDSSKETVKNSTHKPDTVTAASIQTTGEAITPASIQETDSAVSIIPTVTDDNAALSVSKKDSSKKRLLIKYKNAQGAEGTRKSIARKSTSSSKFSKLNFKKSLKKKTIDVYEVDSSAASDVVNELKKDTGIEYVQEDNKLAPFDMPTDTDFQKQWGLSNTGQTVGSQSGISGVDIGALNAWDKTKGSSNVIVGVLDTGIDISHEDLKDNIYVNSTDNTTGWDFANDDSTVFNSSDGDKHGTHVAGIIAAAQNGKGVSGVAPNIKILPLKFINNGIGYTSDAIDAIEYCKNMGVKIINCSWGGTDENPALKDEMANSGILFVCAAGNFGADSASIPVYPADFKLPNIISVAAVDNTGCLATFSSYGSAVDVAAPGVNIYSTLPGNSYGMLSGTSMASPFVAGEAALVMSANPALSVTDIADRIRKDIVVSNKLSGKVSSGGRINATAALDGVIPSPETNNVLVETTTGSSVILNNDQNKSIDVNSKAGGKNTADANSKIVKPLAASDTSLSSEEKSANTANTGFDTARTDLNSQSISSLSYIMESEPNDTSSLSMPVSIGTVYGTMSSISDKDWYAVSLEANKQYTFKMKGIPQGDDFDIYAYDSNLQILDTSTYSGNADESLAITTTQAGYYYINAVCYVFAAAGDHSYQLMMYPDSAGPDSLEPNDSLATAKVIATNTAINANININTDEDWYAVDAVKAGRLTVSITGVPSGCDYDMAVYDSNSSVVGGSYKSNNSDEKASIFITNPGRYYIRVYSYTGCNPSSNYTLMASVSTPDSYEINESIYEAKDIAAGQSILGTIDNPKDEDWYRINVSQAQNLKINLQHIPQGNDYDLYIYDVAGNYVVSSVAGSNADEVISSQFNQGVYYIKVVPFSGYSEVGQYNLSISSSSAMAISLPYIKSSSGSAITVPVSIDNLPSEGVSCFNFTIKYDKNVMTYTGFDAGALINTTNAGISVEESDDGLNVFYCDESAGTNCPILSPGEIVKLNFQMKAGIPDGAYILGYNDGWTFGKILTGGSITQISDVLFKSGMVTTGVYSTYSEDSLVKTNEQPKMTVLAENAYGLGDIDGNGVVNSIDYLLLKKSINESILLSGDAFKAADADCNGDVNVVDATMVKARVLKKIYYFPKENIALGKTEDHYTSDTGTAKDGCDGSMGTSWKSADDVVSSHYWQVDLGTKCNITGIGVAWNSSYNFSYKIQVSTDGSTWIPDIAQAESNNSEGNLYSNYKFQSIQQGQRYVRITITNLSKDKGFKEFAVFGTPVNVPVNLAVTSKSSSTATLSWAAPSDIAGITGYSVYNGSTKVATVSGVATTTYTVTGLEALKEYIFTVTSVNSNGSESAKSAPLTVPIDVVLTQDTTMDSLNLSQCMVDLNGYKLTVNTNVIQSGGTMNINNGVLEVKGDYKIETADGNESSGILKMVNSYDYVKIAGKFVMHSNKSHSTYLTNGILEVNGNFTQKSGSTTNFNPTGDHKTVLNGEDIQTVTFDSTASKFNLLEINKPLSLYQMSSAISTQALGDQGVKSLDTSSNNSSPFYEKLLNGYKSALGLSESGGVDPATGGYSHNKTDMIVKMIGFDIPVSRSYNSLNKSSGVLGGGWNFSLEGRIDATQYTGGQRMLIVTVPLRGKEVFVDNGTTIKGDGTRSTLEYSASTGKYTLTTKDQYKYVYDSSSLRVVQLIDRNGNTIDVDYTTSGKWKYKDKLDRYLTLDFTNSSSIKVTDNASRTVTYEYNSQNQLVKATDASGDFESYSYNAFGLLNEVRNSKNILMESVYYGPDVDGNIKAMQYKNQLGKITGYVYNKLSTTILENITGSDYALDNGLIAWYKFDGDTNDSTIYRRHGQKSSTGSITFVDGKYGKGVKLESYKSYILLPPATNNLTEGTVSLYFCPDETYDSSHIPEEAALFSATKGLPTSDAGYSMKLRIHYDCNLSCRGLGFYAAPSWAESSANPSSGTWYHAVCTWSESGVKLYVNYIDSSNNNVFVKQENTSYNGTPLAATYNIIGAATDSNCFFKGIIDDAKIYNRALSEEEVKKLCNVNITNINSDVRKTVATYDNSYRVTQILDPEEKTTTIAYNDDGDITSIKDRNGNLTQFPLIVNGNIKTVINPDNRNNISMDYDIKNNLTRVKDENDKYTFYIYDPDNINLVKKVQPLEKGITSYNSANNSDYAITQCEYYTDSEAATLGYQKKGLLKSVTDAKENTTTYTYYSDGSLYEEIVDGDEIVNGQRNKIKTTHHYNNMGLEDYVLSPKGYKTEYTYDSMGRLEKTVQSDTVKSSTARIVYDSLGRKIQEISPNQYNPAKDGLNATPVNHSYSDNSVGTRYTYYDNGLLKSFTDAENNMTTYDSYDKYGNLIQMTKPNSSQYKYDYDNMNRKTKVYFREKATDSSGNPIDWTPLEGYDYSDITNSDAKNSTKVVKTQYKVINDIGNMVTTSIYDYAGRIVDQTVEGTNSKKMKTSTNYNANGTVESVTYPGLDSTSGNVTIKYIYDSMNRLTEEDTPFQKVGNNVINSVKKHDYYNNSSIMTEKISNNDPALSTTFRQTDYDYNSRGLLTKVTSYDPGQTPSNYYTQYFYDADGNKVRMYTGLNTPLTISGLDNVSVPTNGDSAYSTTKYDYNYLHMPTVVTDPLNKATNYTEYDYNGNLKTMTDRNQNTITMAYDNLNRLKSKSAQNTTNPSANISYSYGYEYGNRKTMTGGRDVSYGYDVYERLETESTVADTKGYKYYTGGTRKSFTLNQNNQVVTNLIYVYDDLNRLYQVNEKVKVNGVETEQTVATYNYYDNGSLKKVIYPNNSETYGYNLANKLTLLVNYKGTTEVSKYEYTYYLDGNIHTKTETVNGVAKTTTYVYDGLGRLKSESVTGGVTTSYTYDDYGNRKKMTLTNGVISSCEDYIYDDYGCRLKTKTKTTGSTSTTTSYIYDDNGNQTNDGTNSYKYDGLNQLIGVNNNISYAYNGDGLRISKTVGGITTNHLWDGDAVVADVNGTSVIARYVRGLNLIYSDAGSTNNTKKYYLYNGHGDVIGLTDSTGSVVKNYTYDAFGNEKNPDVNDTNPFRYCGEYFDKETGTIYLRARYYMPGIGRFISEDSYTGKDNDPLSLNLYTYCGNDPVNAWDPSGNNWFTDRWENVKWLGGKTVDGAKWVGGKITGTASWVGGKWNGFWKDSDNRIDKINDEGARHEAERQLKAQGIRPGNPNYNRKYTEEYIKALVKIEQLQNNGYSKTAEALGILVSSNIGPYNWADRNTLEDHFNRHGSDFNAADKDEYAKMANDFYNDSAKHQVKVDEDGVMRVYDSSTNTFGSYNANGTTRSFYKPSGGQRYFDSQPGYKVIP